MAVSAPGAPTLYAPYSEMAGAPPRRRHQFCICRADWSTLTLTSSRSLAPSVRMPSGGRGLGGEGDDRKIRQGQGGRAQEQARRETFDGALHHAVGVLGFHFAVDVDGELGKRALGGEGVGDVAERILVMIEPAIL